MTSLGTKVSNSASGSHQALKSLMRQSQQPRHFESGGWVAAEGDTPDQQVDLGVASIESCDIQTPVSFRLGFFVAESNTPNLPIGLGVDFRKQHAKPSDRFKRRLQKTGQVK